METWPVATLHNTVKYVKNETMEKPMHVFNGICKIIWASYSAKANKYIENSEMP